MVMGDSTEPLPAMPMGAVNYDSLLLGWGGDKEKQAKDTDWETEEGERLAVE